MNKLDKMLQKHIYTHKKQLSLCALHLHNINGKMFVSYNFINMFPKTTLSINYVKPAGTLIYKLIPFHYMVIIYFTLLYINGIEIYLI